MKALTTILMVLVAVGIRGEEEQGDDEWYEGVRERAMLLTGCKPMRLWVTLQEQPAIVGLTEQAIQNAAESRLRMARLFAEENYSKQTLHVGVMVIGNAYTTYARLNRWVSDTGYGLGGTVNVFRIQWVGSHGRDAQHVLGAVASVMDEFLATYLRVNEKACSTETPQGEVKS